MLSATSQATDLLAPNPDPVRLRHKMVQEQLVPRGITDGRVLAAMAAVPRHRFMPEALRMKAYADFPVPIGYGQTISRPFVVAYMTEKLHVGPGVKVLEIGTGSGYQAAILSAAGADVYTIERLAPLHHSAVAIFTELGLTGIHALLGDGTMGWDRFAPYDRIIVTAGGPSIPRRLVDQLSDPGLMLIPVGDARREQNLVRIVKDKGRMTGKILRNRAGISFVDLIGRQGWPKTDPRNPPILDKHLLELSS